MRWAIAIAALLLLLLYKFAGKSGVASAATLPKRTTPDAGGGFNVLGGGKTTGPCCGKSQTSVSPGVSPQPAQIPASIRTRVGAQQHPSNLVVAKESKVTAPKPVAPRYIFTQKSNVPTIGQQRGYALLNNRLRPNAL